MAELRRADKLEDEVKEGLTSFGGGFDESVTICGDMEVERWGYGGQDEFRGLVEVCNGLKGEVEKS